MARSIGEQELAWLPPELRDLGPREQALMNQFVHRLTRKILHAPVRALHNPAGNGQSNIYAENLKTLFALADDV